MKQKTKPEQTSLSQGMASETEESTKRVEGLEEINNIVQRVQDELENFNEKHSKQQQRATTQAEVYSLLNNFLYTSLQKHISLLLKKAAEITKKPLTQQTLKCYRDQISGKLVDIQQIIQSIIENVPIWNEPPDEVNSLMEFMKLQFQMIRTMLVRIQYTQTPKQKELGQLTFKQHQRRLGVALHDLRKQLQEAHLKEIETLKEKFDQQMRQMQETHHTQSAIKHQILQTLADDSLKKLQKAKRELTSKDEMIQKLQEDIKNEQKRQSEIKLDRNKGVLSDEISKTVKRESKGLQHQVPVNIETQKKIVEICSQLEKQRVLFKQRQQLLREARERNKQLNNHILSLKSSESLKSEVQQIKTKLQQIEKKITPHSETDKITNPQQSQQQATVKEKSLKMQDFNQQFQSVVESAESIAHSKCQIMMNELHSRIGQLEKQVLNKERERSKAEQSSKKLRQEYDQLKNQLQAIKNQFETITNPQIINITEMQY